MPLRVLCILADGFEEIEAVTPIDLLRRAGVEVILAGLNSFEITGRSGITLRVEHRLDEDLGSDFALLLLPGGPAVTALRADGRAAKLAAEFTAAHKWVAAICAAPTILQDAGLLEGLHFTAHDSTLPELPTADLTQAVIQDGLIITSRGAGTALAFGLHLVEVLTDATTRQRIASAILV
jgi:4-methyl-5(b-hydroxyethyl)-thiazole monophosphate biosynthesis